MFNEDEDWNDEEEAQVPSKTVVNRNLKSNSSKHVKVSIFLLKKNDLHVQISCLWEHVSIHTIHILLNVSLLKRPLIKQLKK